LQVSKKEPIGESLIDTSPTGILYQQASRDQRERERERERDPEYEREKLWNRETEKPSAKGGGKMIPLSGLYLVVLLL